MEPPRGWRPPPGGRAPLQVPPSIRRARYQPGWPTPQAAEKQAAGPPTLPHWKRFVLMYVRPVCLAMVWQLAVILGCLAAFLLGLTLLKLLRP
jgi:hypothetical protein